MINYFRPWDFMRYLRLAMGIFIIITGVQVNDWMFVSLGAIFSAMPIFNIGCCGINSCRTVNCVTPTQNNDKMAEIEDVQYQEVK
jgi:hypothetical protein